MTVGRIAKILLLMVALLFAGCGYDRFGSVQPSPPAGEPYNVDVGDLRGLCREDIAVLVDRNMIVCGAVTSNDKAGNFYCTLVIEDATGAIELKVGMYDMHNIYPAGQIVTVKLQGLSLALETGVVQAGVGAAAWSGYKLDYIGQRSEADRYIFRDEVYDPVEPQKIAISALLENMCGRMVSVDGLTYNGDPGLSWATAAHDGWPASAGYRRFIDAGGSEIFVLSSGYASFAAAAVPEGVRLRITGVLMYGSVPGTGGRSAYILKINDLSGVVPEG